MLLKLGASESLKIKKLNTALRSQVYSHDIGYLVPKLKQFALAICSLLWYNKEFDQKSGNIPNPPLCFDHYMGTGLSEYTIFSYDVFND